MCTAGAFALLAAIPSAGCNSSGAAADAWPGGEPVQAVRGAADALVRAGSSRMRTSMEMNSGATRVTVRGTGTFDYAKGQGRLRVIVPQAPDQPITELLALDTLYMKNRGGGVPEDKWLRLDTTRLSDGNLVTNGATDPRVAAELLRGAEKVSYEGSSRTPDGTAVRHYRGTADVGKAAKAASPYASGALKAAAKGFASDKVTFDAYLDREGRLRKVRHEFAFTQGQEVEVASTTEMYAFGTGVTVVLPAREDIYAGVVQDAR